MYDFKTCATLKATFKSDLEDSFTIAVHVMSFSKTVTTEASQNSLVWHQWYITAKQKFGEMTQFKQLKAEFISM